MICIRIREQLQQPGQREILHRVPEISGHRQQDPSADDLHQDPEQLQQPGQPEILNRVPEISGRNY